MKSLKNFDWKENLVIIHKPFNEDYNSLKYYRSAFSNSSLYRRTACYYSATSIEYLCEGITELIECGGHMKMIIGSSLTKADQDAINNGLTREEYLSMKWKDCLDDVRNNRYTGACFEALAWLVANGKLEIKIAINVDENNKILSDDYSKFHEKVAIFSDDFDNHLVTIGSGNETGAAYERNREVISLTTSWNNNNAPQVKVLIDDFESLWDDNEESTRTFPISEAMRADLISMAKPEKPTRSSFKNHLETSSQIIKTIGPRAYQNEAIQSWYNANYRGILEMATGTGKTLTALFACRPFAKEGNILVIVVPRTEIAQQWFEECNRVYGNDVNILICGSKYKWKEEIANFLNKSSVCFVVVIAILNTFCSSLHEYVKKYSKRITLIIDEVHEIGAYTYGPKLMDLPDIQRRLGLSATPERYRDEEGTNTINDYFGNPPVYQYTIHEAIYPSKPGQERMLCEYNYHIHYSSLSQDELIQYRELSIKISNLSSIPEKDRNKHYYDKLCRDRALVLKGCASRLNTLKDILENHGNKLKKCIIYCNTIKESKMIHKMMYSMGLRAVTYHSNNSNREAILESFKECDFIRFLISIACLDQGVDIPCCDSAIILSSTDNPRQYVQRRGRILRLYSNKDVAEIHDVMITPYEIDSILFDDRLLDDVEIRMIEKQSKRIKIFIDDAKNKSVNEFELFKLERHMRR